MLPKLRDVIEQVMEAGNMTQAELALKLYGSEKKQGKLSVMLGTRYRCIGYDSFYGLSLNHN